MSVDREEANESDETAVSLGEAPIKPDQEWANALSHGIATAAAIVIAITLVRKASGISTGMAIACAAYSITVIGTFASSTLSHAIFRQPWLNTFRAWDQAMIYMMITGTYTPIVAAFAPNWSRAILLVLIWVAAIAGFLSKTAVKHRVNSISTVSYLLLGWLPALPLIGHVPTPLAWGMLTGGVLYSLGVVFLITDHRVKYFHLVWHGFVMAAAFVHYRVIIANCLAE